MSDTVSETKACDLLARLFRSRGYVIARNVVFREYGVEFHADGWDPKARIGFEFLSSEDDDHDDLTLAEYQTLMAAQQRGELALFIIDEVEPLSAAELVAAAEEFLDEAADARSRRGARKARPTKPAHRAGAKPARAVVKRAAKPTAKTVVRKKTAKKKSVSRPVKKKRTASRRG